MRAARAVLLLAVASSASADTRAPYLLNDCHFHLTNYVQEGTDIKTYLGLMGDKVGRTAIFGIPLQQEWSYRDSGDRAPTYYLQSDAPLYYYSFVDAHIAMAYRSLTRAQQARLDPMITGFNPADMYAADQIRRVLETFPGVFTGIGEFTIHKEFVSAKIAGDTPSLRDPALDRLLDFAAEVGLVVLIHSDIDAPFPKPDEPPAHLADMVALLKRHPKNAFIWAHIGLGRIIRPVGKHGEVVRRLLDDPELKHVSFDISWAETAKYLTASDEALRIVADIMNQHPDRFLFGTDEVAPKAQDKYLAVFHTYDPLWKLLDKETSEKVRLKNYERIFDAARVRVRAWEKAHPAPPL